MAHEGGEISLDKFEGLTTAEKVQAALRWTYQDIYEFMKYEFAEGDPRSEKRIRVIQDNHMVNATRRYFEVRDIDGLVRAVKEDREGIKKVEERSGGRHNMKFLNEGIEKLGSPKVIKVMEY